MSVSKPDKNKFVVGEFNRNDYKIIEEGNQKDSQKDGTWKTYIIQINDKKLLYTEENFNDGQLHGPYIKYFLDGGEKEKGVYQNGEKSGQWKHYWYTPHHLSSLVTYKNGKQNGPYEQYDFSGKRLTQKGTLKDGKRNGKWIEYRSDDRQRYHKGKYEKELIYKNGLLHGHCKFYDFMFGYLLREGKYKDDKPDGLWKYYHYSGRLTKEINYKDGEFHGRMIHYFSDGKRYREEFYKDGTLIESKPPKLLSTQP